MGVKWQVTDKFLLQGRLFIPVLQDWNGDARRNVGQVAPDITTQITASNRFGKVRFFIA